MEIAAIERQRYVVVSSAPRRARTNRFPVVFCRRKKKCIRYMGEGGDGDGEADGEGEDDHSEDNLGSVGEAGTPEEDESLSSPGGLSALSSLASPSLVLPSPSSLASPCPCPLTPPVPPPPLSNTNQSAAAAVTTTTTTTVAAAAAAAAAAVTTTTRGRRGRRGEPAAEAAEEKSGRRQEREKNQEGSSKCHEGTLVSEWWTVVPDRGGTVRVRQGSLAGRESRRERASERAGDAGRTGGEEERERDLRFTNISRYRVVYLCTTFVKSNADVTNWSWNRRGRTSDAEAMESVKIRECRIAG